MGAQTVHGLIVGLEVCAIAECEDFRVFGPVLAVGTLGGLIGSIVYSDDGISSGRAAAINTGTVFGFGHGALLAFAFEAGSPREVSASLLAGQLVGTIAGGALWDRHGKPSLDDMAFAAGFGALSLYATGPGWAGDEETSQLVRGLSAIAIMDGAITTAWIVRKELPMSWGRGGIIAVSGFAGAFGGLGVDALIEGDDPNVTTLMLLMAAGTYTGAIVAALNTRGFDGKWADRRPQQRADDPQDSYVIVPTVAPTQDGGAVAGLAVAW